MPIEGCDHRDRHFHGTRAAYTTHECRCDDCRDAQNTYQQMKRTGRIPVADADPALDHFDHRIELPQWHLDAACRGADHELFFPGKGESVTSHRARAICARCPVQVECLTWAVENKEPGGIWGGTTERDRRKIRSLAKAEALGEVVSAFVKEAS